MIVKVQAELMDADVPVLGYRREEVVYLDLPDGVSIDDSAKHALAYHAAIEEAGIQLLDFLAEAERSLGKQSARLSKSPIDGGG